MRAEKGGDGDEERQGRKEERVGSRGRRDERE